MGGGSKGGGSTTTVQKADPWSGVQPYLTSAYSQLQNLYGGGTKGPAYYPGDTIADISNYERLATQGMIDRMGTTNQLGSSAASNLNAMGDLARGQTFLGMGSLSDSLNRINQQSGQYGQGAGEALQSINALQQNAQAGAGGMQLATNAGQSLMNAAQGTKGGDDAAQYIINRLIDSTGSTAGGAQQAANMAAQLRNEAMRTSGGTTAANNAWMGLQGIGQDVTGAGTETVENAMARLYAAGNPQNNPYFQQAVQSAIRPVTENFQEQVMPGIRQGAQAAGQQGSSRQGIAEGIAARGYMNTVGDISANMGNQAYAQGLQAVQASGQLGQGLAGLGASALGQSGQIGTNLAGLTAQQLGQAGQLGSQLGQLNLGQMSQAGNLGAQLGQLNLNQLSQAGGLGIDQSSLLGQQMGQAGSLGANLAGTNANLQMGLANLGSNMVQNAAGNYSQAVNQTGDAQQALMYSPNLLLQLGQQQTADAQREIDAQIARYNYNQQLPFTQISDYLQLLQGAPGGTTSSMASQSGGGNRFTGVLGGAMTGAGLGSMFGPWGVGIGGGLGALSGLF